MRIKERQKGQGTRYKEGTRLKTKARRTWIEICEVVHL